MRTTLVLAILMPAPAVAHVGHLGEVAGHDHWIAAAALGAAAAAALWAAWKGREPSAAKPEEEDEPEAEGAGEVRS